MTKRNTYKVTSFYIMKCMLQPVPRFLTVLKPNAPVLKIIGVSSVMVRSQTLFTGQPILENRALTNVVKVSTSIIRNFKI